MFIYGGHDIREGSLDSLWMIELSRLSDGDQQTKAGDFSDA